MIIIVSITNFSIIIGSPRAYLSGNRRVITCVSNYRCSIWTFVIGYLRDFHVNYARFNVFLRDVFYSFQNLLKAPVMFSLKRNSQKTFLFRNLLWIRLISNCTSCRTIQGIILLIVSKRPRASCSSDFEITPVITPWIVFLPGPITITYDYDYYYYCCCCFSLNTLLD